MTKTLLIIAIVALIIFYYYQKKAKAKPASEENWIWAAKDNNLPTPEDWQTKYRQKSKQLDEEQLENNKLQAENENLKQELQSLKLSSQDDSEELKTLNQELEDLTSERDEATRERNEAQAENLSLSNKLKLKQQEVSHKEAEIQRITELLNNSESKIERLKKEKNLVEVNLNKKITTLNKEKQQLKKEHTEQLRKINLLFDPQAKDYQTIDFNGLYSLLEKATQRNE